MRKGPLLIAAAIGLFIGGMTADASAGELLRGVRNRVAYRVSTVLYPPTPLAVYVDPLGPAFIYPPPGPIGHRITATGPNGYNYSPIYPEDLEAPRDWRAERAPWRGIASEFERWRDNREFARGADRAVEEVGEVGEVGEEVEAPLDDQAPLPPIPQRAQLQDDSPWEF